MSKHATTPKVDAMSAENGERIMNTLSEFLRARIAEDEAASRSATTGPWEAWSGAPGGGGEYVRSQTTGYTFSIDPGVTGDEGWQNARRDAEHIARHDPARVLAECAFKRRAVRMLEAYADDVPDDPHSWDDGEWARFCTYESVCADMAVLYADHPDYRPEWRAEA